MPRGGGAVRRIDCDVVCVSGGWNPAVHLHSQARGTLRFDDALAAFVPDRVVQAATSVGAANGTFVLAAALAEGHVAGAAAASASRHAPDPALVAPSGAASRQGPLEPLWAVPPARKGAKCFVDWQNDVTVDDVALAAREGYVSVEHLKRYTTLGMGTDQGKTSNVVGLALMAGLLDRPVQRVGTTTFRPPYTPVTLGAIAGHESGAHLEPTRRTALHDWHAAHGARFVTAGLWLRPHSYPRAGETPDDAANREARNVRVGVGVVDVSTLGKIELQGRDVARLLDRVYINRWDNLAVGRCRYGVMLRDDGIVLDDGTTSRLADTHYLMTTTTVNAVRVMQHLEQLLQVEWPDLDVHVCSVTEQWCAVALSGPRAREVLARVVDIDVGNAAFPFLAVGTCQVRTADGPTSARLFRMSYSGELAYEVHVPADRGPATWQALLDAGADLGIQPYGTEAMSTLRIEKGHVVVGAEADGRTTADDLGMGKLVNPSKWCIGKPLLARAALNGPSRWQLVGLTSSDPSVPIPRGAKLVEDPRRAVPNPMLGHVTSWCWSPNLDAWIALALLENGRARHGATVWAVSPLANAQVRVRVGPPVFIDPDGERLRG
jgi:sarcosine oxidase subunit alpha